MNPDVRHLDRATCDRLRHAGLAVHVWTVNDPTDIARLSAWGVDGIITDDPALALSVRGR